jgi:hypothetical protein
MSSIHQHQSLKEILLFLALHDKDPSVKAGQLSDSLHRHGLVRVGDIAGIEVFHGSLPEVDFDGPVVGGGYLDLR